MCKIITIARRLRKSLLRYATNERSAKRNGKSDERAKLKKEWEVEDDKLKNQQDVIKQALLTHCKETGAKSVKTEAGTFFRSVKNNYFVTDWGSVYDFIKENSQPELLQGRLHQANLEQFFVDNPDTVIKGVQSNSEYSINVRKAKGA